MSGTEPLSKEGLICHPDKSFNVETPTHWLRDRITPASIMFVRNNGLPADPAKIADDWLLTVDGYVTRELRLTIGDLRRILPMAEITTVMECAGNGRSLLPAPAEGIPWGLGAVACATFAGFRMADVLALAGIAPQAVYIGHISEDLTAEGKPALSRGLPLDKAMAPETLLAVSMNGEDLPHAHGGPLRVVAPGYPGSAWQKWLTRIWVRDREHDGARMTGLDYRLPRKPISPGDPVDPSSFDVITHMPPRALITSHAYGEDIAPTGRTTLSGWAWGHGEAVTRVGISLDAANWHDAELEPLGSERFAWQAFRFQLPQMPTGPFTVIARATTAFGLTQPLTSAPWNPKGYCNNGCQRLALLAP